MGLLRVSVLFGLLAAVTCVLARSALDPMLAGWRALTASGGSVAGPASADLVALLTGGCALLAALAWMWLLASVGGCTWEALRAGPTGADLATVTSGAATLWRPRAVRVVVAAALGVTALAGPAAHGSVPAARGRTLRDDLRPTAVIPSTTTVGLLDGLPVPDRVAGGSDRSTRAVPGRGAGRGSDRATAVDRSLRVGRGDCLWTLSAALLPADSPATTVAAAWRLLYAANRDVVGPDPDLLHPGQTLRIDAALAALVQAAHAGTTPLHHHAGGSR